MRNGADGLSRALKAPFSASWFCERQYVTWANEAAVSQRACTADRVAIDHGNFPTILLQISRTGDTDQAAANDDD